MRVYIKLLSNVKIERKMAVLTTYLLLPGSEQSDLGNFSFEMPLGSRLNSPIPEI